jgi:hypothetical protein
LSHPGSTGRTTRNARPARRDPEGSERLLQEVPLEPLGIVERPELRIAELLVKGPRLELECIEPHGAAATPAAFFSQFLAQLQQLQCPDGTVESCIPNTDPERDGQPKPLPCAAAEGDPSWGTVYPTIAWGVWKYYAALGEAVRQYPNLLRYMAMLERAVNATGLGNIFCTWGDWNPVVPTSCHITAAASYLHDLEHMVELAAALGEAADAAAFAATLATRRVEYHAAFWNRSLGLYGAGSQAAQAVALWTGVAAGAGVAGNVSAWLGTSMAAGGLTFGFIGVRYAFEALALNGRVEDALRCLLQTGYPSYGFEL